MGLRLAWLRAPFVARRLPLRAGEPDQAREGDLVAGQFPYDVSPAEDERPIAQVSHFLEVAGQKQNAAAAGERLVHKSVDLRSGPDVHALRGLLQHEDRAGPSEPAGE